MADSKANSDQFNKYYTLTAAVVQWVRALASPAKGWVFETPLRQTQAVKTGNDSSTA